MTHQLFIMVFPLIALCVVAAVIDLRSRRIPNWLTVMAMVSGLANSMIWSAPTTPVYSLLGLLAGVGILFVPFAIGAMGGGDVKLLAGVGAWLGTVATLQVFVVSALAGLVIVLIQCAFHRRLPMLFKNSAVLVANIASYQQLGHDHVVQTGQSMRSVDKPLPYAVPILIGVLTTVAMNSI
jgi:prepilin peptidase CpaA